MIDEFWVVACGILTKAQKRCVALHEQTSPLSYTPPHDRKPMSKLISGDRGAKRIAKHARVSIQQACALFHCLFSRWLAPNKMQGHFRHLLLTQFFMLFHMVPSVLLSMVAI